MIGHDAPSGITVAERRELIVDTVERVPQVSVGDLASRFGVTEVSIRRDLTMLEDQGRLRRIHGGAVAVTRRQARDAFALRERLAHDEKRRIGLAAASLVNPADVVVFDSGTTVNQVAIHVGRSPQRASALTIVTSSLPVLDEVSRWDNPHLICLGGLYLPEHEALVGPQTVADLRDLSADIAFIGCDGLTVRAGLTTPHVLVAEVGAVIAAVARRVVVVADASKIGRQGFTPIVPLSGVDVLVTSVGADPAEVDQARAAGVEVILV
jgi:DeoR/GlpR family transcriptional regulator of sugar metabolism